MTVYEFTIVIAVTFGLAALRFGIPLLLTWGISHLLTAFARPSS